MRGFLDCYDGTRLELPALLKWRLEYTAGVPCDSFSLECLWKPGEERRLSNAVRFTAVEDGEIVFSGVVDEYECHWDERGGRLTVSGRGMAALLLDNEAVGADYQVATLEDILRDHVTPYGIGVGARGNISAVKGFSVKNGSSEWQVLYEFARYHGGVTPRFDRTGRLVLSGWEKGRTLVLDGKSPVSELAYQEKRYGVLSEILVRDRTDKNVQKIRNPLFLSQGGMCRRVLTMPSKSSYQAMRYSGEYQLKRSEAGRRRISLSVPRTFFAWPGDLLDLNLEKPSILGLWRVLEAVTGVEDTGYYTRLVLGEPDVMV